MAVKFKTHDEAGFSLIEVMVALTILGFVLTGVVAMFVQTGRYHTGQEMTVEMTQDIRAAKNLMVDEIRSAGCNPDDAARVGFQRDPDDRFDTDANSIHFTRDIDNGDGDGLYEPDGDVDDANEDISYYRVDSAGTILDPGDNTTGTLVRNSGGGGQPVVDNVVDLQFQYYDSANNLIAPAAMNKTSVLDTIRTVEVLITGQVQNLTRVSAGQETWTQQFRIRVRNL